jgi:hypothetical protein
MKDFINKTLIICAFMAMSLASYAQGNHYYEGNTLYDPYGKFQLTFLTEPKYSYQDIETAVGTVRMYMFMMETQDAAFMASYVDYPADMVAQANKDDMLKGALNGYINHLQLTLRSESKINYGSHPGLLFYADNSQMYTVLRDFLVNNRLYQLGILKMGEISVQQENEFFDSFVLTK